MSQCIFNLPISEFCFRNPWFSFYEYHKSICHVSAFISSWSLCFSNLSLIPTFCFFWLLLPPHFYCEAFSFHVIIFQLIESYFYCFTKCPQIYFYSYYYAVYYISWVILYLFQNGKFHSDKGCRWPCWFSSWWRFSLCVCIQILYTRVFTGALSKVILNSSPQSSSFSISNWRVFVLVCTEKRRSKYWPRMGLGPSITLWSWPTYFQFGTLYTRDFQPS